MNVTDTKTMNYENFIPPAGQKTNPIQTQSKPIPENPKMNANIFITKDYENEPPSGPKKTNPN